MTKTKFLNHLAIFILSQLILFSFGSLAMAKADDLVVQDDGRVVLVLTDGSGVLGISTPGSTKSSTSIPAKPPVTSPSPSQKIVPLVPAHVKSTVQVNPPVNNDKKLEVTITTGAAASVQPAIFPTVKALGTTVPSNSSAAKPSGGVLPVTPSPSNAPLPAPNNIITKTVDQVVAQGSGGQPIVSIKSDQANQVTIEQGSAKISTSLPIQIDSQTHALSAVTPNGVTKISVLPMEAVKGVSQQGFITNGPTTQTTLAQENGQIIYKIQGEKKGKLLGLFETKTPVEVKISAQTGKIVKTSQSLFFNVFGFLVK